MSDLNQVTLTGRLGADPEIRRTQDGKPIVNLRLAVGDQWRDRNSGERKERTTWVPVIVFSEGLAKIAEQYLRKGMRILVQGAFSVREWTDQQQNKRSTTEVVLQGFDAKLMMLDKAADREPAPSSKREDDKTYARQQEAKRGYGAEDLDDEIPF